ncbi:MAG TPA: HAMP domain-containing sensor histidine kinase [Ktedonobacteraceae bacterium]
MCREEQAQRRQGYVAHLPWWRKPLVGYLLVLPFMALIMLLPLLFIQLDVDNPLIGAPVFLVSGLVAWLWGTGPAIVAIVLSGLSLDDFFVSPFGHFTLDWHETLPLVPLMLAQLVVTVLIAQLKSVHQQALFARQELETRASELEQANQALEQANQIKDQFLSMASHELRTPLTVMRTQVQFDLRRLAKQQELPPDVAPLRETLEQVDEQTHQLQGLVDVFLGLSVLREERMPLRLAPCDLNALCRKVLEEQQAISGRSIVLQVPSTPIILNADGERIRQVVTNLVTNAIKYSPEASRVLISLSQSTTGATLQVHNDGKPISIQQQKRIFELYYRTPNARSSQEEGWGLGLAICKEIVKRHQGRIWVESSNERGTSFFVWLPLNVSLS